MIYHQMFYNNITKRKNQKIFILLSLILMIEEKKNDFKNIITSFNS